MSTTSETTSINELFVKTVFDSKKELDEFVKCCDPNQGHVYFMDNFYKVQHPVKGVIQYKATTSQAALLNTYHANQKVIVRSPRQAGKTTAAIGYMLWYAMFVPDSVIVISASKLSSATDMLQRLVFSYDCLPDYIKIPLVKRLKGAIQFENGSMILTTAANGHSVRGRSVSLMYVDEFACVPSSNAREMMEGVFPVIASACRSKILIASTPISSDDFFSSIWKDAETGSNGFVTHDLVW